MEKSIIRALNLMPTYDGSGDARRILIGALLKEGITPKKLISEVPSCFFTTEIEDIKSEGIPAH